MACWLTADLLLFVIIWSISCAPYWIRCVLAVLLVYRVVEIDAYALRIAVLDRVIRKQESSSPFVASHERLIILGIINYIEMIICFAGIYAVDSSLIRGPEHHTIDWADPLYLSAVTQLTIGYGDLSPTGSLRLFAILQGLSSVFLLVILIGRFLSLLVPDRSLAIKKHEENK